MAGVKGPLFSLGASGTIAKTLVYSTWKGIPYVRTHVIPYNPQEVKQLEVRGIFSTLSEMYKRMPQLARDPWQAAVKGEPLTDRNLHVKENLKVLIDETTLDLLVMSVARGQAVPPASATFVAGPGTITITGTADTLPVGYTLTTMTAAICKDGEPGEVFVTAIIAMDAASPTFEAVFEDLEEVAYQGAIWCVYERTKDVKVFYSTAVRGQATPTA